MSKCSRTRDIFSEMEETNKLVDNIVNNKLEEESPGYTKFAEESSMFLMERFSLDAVNDNLINEAQFDELKFPNEKERVLHKILTMLADDHMLLEQYRGILSEIIALKYKPKKGDPTHEDLKGQKMGAQLRRLDTGVLKDIFAGLVNRQRIMQGEDTDVFGRGRIGDFFIAYKTPEQLGLMEASGAVLKFARHMNEYARNISRKIERDWSDNPATKERGMETIIEEASLLRLTEDETTKTQFNIEFAEESMEDKKRKFFYFLARGIIRKNEDGAYEIATTYGPRTDENGEILRYEPRAGQTQGDIMYQLGDYTPVYEYTDEDGNVKSGWQDNYLAIPYTKQSFKDLDKLMLEYREKNSKIWARKDKDGNVVGGIPHEFEQSVKQLLLNFDKAFPELAGQEMTFMEGGEEKTFNLGNIILFGKNPSIKEEAMNGARDILSPKKVKLLDKMIDTFGRFINDTRILSKSENVDEDRVETYFPVIYHDEYVERGFYGIENNIRMEIQSIESQLEVGPDDKLEGRLEQLNNKLDNIIETQKQLMAAGEDGISGDKIIFQNNSKHFKSYTGALDIRNMRTDKGVYYDYLRYNYAQIERNTLTAKLIESMAMTENESVWDYLIDHYNVPFNGKDTKTKLGLFDLDPHGNIVSKLMSPDKLDRVTKKASAFLTWSLLGKPMTGIVNTTAAFQNIYKYSLEETSKAFPLSIILSESVLAPGFTSGETEASLNALQNILARSGVVDMSNFFGEAIVDKISENMLEQEVHKRILDLMAKYIVLSQKDPGNATQYQSELNNEISNILNKSKKFNESFRPEIQTEQNLSKIQVEQIERSHNLNKQRKSESIAQAMVQFAINKSLPMFNHIESSGTLKGKSLTFLKKTGLSTYRTILGKVLKPVSMGHTERLVRTIPFVIGIQRAIADKKFLDKNGEPKSFDKFTPQEVEEAIRIGKLYSDKSNYSLSTTGLGAAFRGPYARVTSKLVGWSNQKFQDDVGLIKQLYRSYADLNSIERGEIDRKAKWKTIMDMYRLPLWATAGGVLGAAAGGALLPALGVVAGMTKGAHSIYKKKIKNETDYAVRETQKFLLMQGLTTFATDMILFGAASSFKGVRNIMYKSGLIGTATQRVAGGFSSDLLSLAYAPLIIALQAAMSDSEDEENFATDKLRYYMRRLPLGFAVNWSIDNIIQFVDYMMGSVEFQDLIGNVTRPITSGLEPTGVEHLVTDPAKEIGSKAWEQLFD